MPCLPQICAPVGKSGPLHDFQHFHQRDVRVFNQLEQAFAYLGEVMRREACRHTDGNSGAAVDEKVRKFCWQHDRLGRGFVVIWNEIDSVFVEIFQHVDGGRRHSRFGISHGRRRVAIDRTKVTLPVD